MSEDERDPMVDAAWRRASHEEPSQAVDTAIRAAARHAAGRSSTSRRNKNWWYPLAAAATVAVFAVGIAQLTPPERVGPSVSDMAATRGAQGGAAPAATAKDAAMAASPAPKPQEALPATPVPSEGAGAVASERGRQSPARGAPRPAAQARAHDEVERIASERAAANSPVAGPAAAPAPAARPEAFPAVTASQPHPEASLEEASPGAQVATGAVKAPTHVAARVANADEARVAQASARSVDDWIKRIRDLKNAGRFDEAAKELAAFRSAYGEHADALLPADLRQAKP